MDHGEDSAWNSSHFNTARDRGYLMEDGEQCGTEDGKSEETDDVQNQSSSSHSTSGDAEELLGACAASGQERNERSQYHLCDEETKTLLSGTSTNVQTESTPWPSQDPIQDATSEATDDRSLTSAVVGDSSSDSYLGLDQHVAEARANREQLQREREEREQFGRDLERKGLIIREQRVRQRMDQNERVEPQQQEAPATAYSQYTYSGVAPTENCEICSGFTCTCVHITDHEEQPQLQSHQCKTGRSGERREREFVEARRGSTQEQNTCAAFSQQYGQYSRAAPTHNCWICNRFVDCQLPESHQECEPSECCICLALLDPDIDCYTLPCLHQLHVECAIELLRNDHRVCPLCRIPLF